MRNKCTMEITKKRYIMCKTLHKVWGGGGNWVGENRIRTTVAINVELSFRNSDLNSNSSPRINISPIFTCVFMFGHIENLSWPLFNSLKAQFFRPLSTNLLYWAHTPTLLSLGYNLWPYSNKLNIIVIKSNKLNPKILKGNKLNLKSFN